MPAWVVTTAEPADSGRHGRSAILAAVALIALSLAWVVWRATVPGDAAPVIPDPGFRQGLTVDPLPHSGGALHPSDLVVSINGVGIDRWLGGAPPSHLNKVLTYRVRHDGQPRLAAVAVDRQDVTSARLRSDGGALLCAIAILGLGGYTVYRRRNASAAQSLLILGAGLTAYATVTTFGYDAADLANHRGLFFTGFVGSTATLLLWGMAASYLAVTFPRPMPIIGRHPRALVSGYAITIGGISATAVALLATGSGTLSRLDVIMSVTGAALTVLSLLTVAGLLHTLWRAWRDPLARSQGLVVVVGFAISAIGLLVANLVAGDQKWPAWLDILLLMPLPLAVTTAILRGDFLGIRAVLNRTLVYLSLTAFLIAVYAAIVTAVGALLGHGGVAREVVATAAVAIAFAPLRSSLQRGVDRLLYGARGDRGKVQHLVAQQLEAATDPGDVLPAVAAAVAGALHLPYVAVRTATADGSRLAAERGERASELQSIALVHHGAVIGELVVAPRRGERSLSTRDASLLADIASQVAPAVRAARLVTDLAATNNRLAVAREEERARLRHDLHDRLGPHLVGLSLQLDVLATRLNEADVSAAVAKAHAEATVALDEVRRISRGLRPAELEELGLVQAIDAAASRMSIADDETSWSVSVDAAIQLGQIPAEVESAAYQIALESLTNAYRHSGGSGAVVRVGIDAAGRELILEITDDGHGIDGGSTPGVGIRSMHARAQAVDGEVTIGRTTGAGTTVRARLPLR